MNNLLVTGATGFIGAGLVKHYNDMDNWDITALGRNPEKLNRLKLAYPKIDVALHNSTGITSFLKYPDVVVHTAAQKYVQFGETDPAATIESNINLTLDMLMSSIALGIRRFVLISTDKSANAGNVYGMTKYLAERAVLSVTDIETVVCRFGNVFGSTGSVMPLWLDAAKNGRTLKITNPNMTRFMFRLRDAIETIEYAIEVADDKDIIVPKMRAVMIGTLYEAFKEFAKQHLGIDVMAEIVGSTPGEKLHESLNCPNESRGVENEHIFTLNNKYNYPPINMNISSEYVDRISKEEIIEWLIDEYGNNK